MAPLRPALRAEQRAPGIIFCTASNMRLVEVALPRAHVVGVVGKLFRPVYQLNTAG